MARKKRGILDELGEVERPQHGGRVRWFDTVPPLVQKAALEVRSGLAKGDERLAGISKATAAKFLKKKYNLPAAVVSISRWLSEGEEDA